MSTMSMPRFFVDGVFAAGDEVRIEGADARKIATVLRMRSGDAAVVIDSAARAYSAELDIANGAVRARLIALWPDVSDASASGAPAVTIAQGIPKGQKMDFVVEKLTELGVRAIVPLESERSVVTDIGAAKLERWRRLAKTAAAQCGRTDVPAVEQPSNFNHMLARFADFDTVLFPWELAPQRSLYETLPELLARSASVLVMIGPEGGFSHDETEAARSAGAQVLSLGSRILRTETSGLVAAVLVEFCATHRK